MLVVVGFEMLDSAKCICFSSATEAPESTLELVQIYFDTATFNNIEKDQRLKFDAQISLIGGTMGLLTVFSIISGLEVVFFILKFFTSFRANM